MRMGKLLILVLLAFGILLYSPNFCFGFFSKEDELQSETNKVTLKRQKETRKLIAEGEKLIKKANKNNDKKLLVKGRIKKEIGEKQLRLLREEIEDKIESSKDVE